MAFAAAIVPIISAVAAIGGTVATLAGANMQANAQKQQADQEQAIAKYNADRQLEQAALSQSKGAIDSYNMERKGTAAAAQARAAQAEGGLSTSEGTPLLLAQSFASETRWREDLAMADATNQAGKQQTQAAITQYEGNMKADSLRSQAGATLLQGFASAAGQMGKAFVGGKFG